MESRACSGDHPGTCTCSAGFSEAVAVHLAAVALMDRRTNSAQSLRRWWRTSARVTPNQERVPERGGASPTITIMEPAHQSQVSHPHRRRAVRIRHSAHRSPPWSGTRPPKRSHTAPQNCLQGDATSAACFPMRPSPSAQRGIEKTSPNCTKAPAATAKPALTGLSGLPPACSIHSRPAVWAGLLTHAGAVLLQRRATSLSRGVQSSPSQAQHRAGRALVSLSWVRNSMFVCRGCF